MNELEDLRAAVWAQPHDDLPRLVYADCLENQGNAARAEFIRLQCQHFRTEKYLDEWYALGDRVEKLWQKHKKTWQAELPESVRKYRFERGFVSPPQREITAAKFMALTEADLAAAPLWRFNIKNNGPQLIKAWHHKNTARLQGLYYGDPYSHDIDAIFDSKHIHNLQNLSMWNTSIKNRTIEKLCSRATDLPHLTGLDFTATRVTDPGLKCLVESPLMGRLQTLTIGFNNFSADAVENLADSSSCSALRQVEVQAKYQDQSSRATAETRAAAAILRGRNWTRLNRYMFDIYEPDHLVQVMRTATPVFQLRHVVIQLSSSLTDGQFEAIAHSPLLKNVRELGLWHKRMTVAHAQILATSPVLGPLRKLDIRYVDSDLVQAQKIIRDRFGKIDTPMMS